MIILTSIAFVLALVVGVLLLRSRSSLGARYAPDKPQRFHTGQVSRLGGLAISAGLLGAWLICAAVDGVVVNLNLRISLPWVFGWVVALMPALWVGLLEDVTQRLSVSWRLLATLISAALACALLDLSITRLDIGLLDMALAQWPWLGIVLALVAIAGLPHAFNIIDGYNGLAGTVAALICLALAHVALQVGDRTMCALMMALVGATAGFLFWNYPRGLIFAGDSGAYLWGMVVAVGAILLVQRNPSISPWFPLLLLIYPVGETLFSIYRKSARGVSPGMADALHFHQLIFRRLVRKVFHDDQARQLLIRNNRTSPYLWGFTALTVFPAVLFWQNTPVLMFFCGLFVVSYVLAYLAIVRFKVPGWLRR